MIKDQKILIECGCADACCILRLEYFNELDEIYLQVNPKWRHKSHGAIISKEKARILRNYLNEFLGERNEKIL